MFSMILTICRGIQLTGTKVRPKLISSPQGRKQSLSLGINPIDNAVPCVPHDNIDDSHLCDDYRDQQVVCHMPEPTL